MVFISSVHEHCMGMLDSVLGHFGMSKPGAGTWMDCPNCKERINLSMDRCPKCGTHIDSMFRIKCPKCKTENSLRAKQCEKCKTLLSLPGAGTGGAPPKPQYACPRCGYRADYFMSECPACGVKFV